MIGKSQREMEIPLDPYPSWMPFQYLGLAVHETTREQTEKRDQPGLRDLFALRIEENRADQAVPNSPPVQTA
jgi:hypothetical protein